VTTSVLQSKFSSLIIFHFTFFKPRRDKGKNAQFQIASLEERDDSGDTEHWQKYPSVVSEKNERLWDALVDALDGYQ
jgi:hypothetical protein